MSRSIQFSLKTMLWLMVCIACFFGGIEFHKAQLKRERRQRIEDTLGTDLAEWERIFEEQRALSKQYRATSKVK